MMMKNCMGKGLSLVQSSTLTVFPWGREALVPDLTNGLIPSCCLYVWLSSYLFVSFFWLRLGTVDYTTQDLGLQRCCEKFISSPFPGIKPNFYIGI